MNPTCHFHKWTLTHQMPNGEERVFKHYKCSVCSKTSRRNVKKPRFTATLRRQPTQDTSRGSKASQKPQDRKRKAIRKVSAKREQFLNQYEAKKKADGELVTAWDLTGGLLTVIHQCRKGLLEPHHPLGRVGCRILFYRWTTPTLHEWIHKRAAWAREQGVILPEMSGRESTPDQLDPFNILPEYRAYVAEHGLH